jgi:hypothetical protein
MMQFYIDIVFFSTILLYFGLRLSRKFGHLKIHLPLTRAGRIFFFLAFALPISIAWTHDRMFPQEARTSHSVLGITLIIFYGVQVVELLRGRPKAI